MTTAKEKKDNFISSFPLSIPKNQLEWTKTGIPNLMQDFEEEKLSGGTIIRKEFIPFKFPGCVASSSDGSRIAVFLNDNEQQNDDTCEPKGYFSSDYGNTWETRSIKPNELWENNDGKTKQFNFIKVTSSSDGKYLVLLASKEKHSSDAIYHGDIYYSTDYGITWNDSMGDFASAKNHPDGGTAQDNDTNNNLGSTRSDRQTRMWISVDSSDNGKIVVAVTQYGKFDDYYGGDIWISNSYGKMFTRYTELTSQFFTDVTISGDGKVVYACISSYTYDGVDSADTDFEGNGADTTLPTENNTRMARIFRLRNQNMGSTIPTDSNKIEKLEMGKRDSNNFNSLPMNSTRISSGFSVITTNYNGSIVIAGQGGYSVGNRFYRYDNRNTISNNNNIKPEQVNNISYGAIFYSYDYGETWNQNYRWELGPGQAVAIREDGTGPSGSRGLLCATWTSLSCSDDGKIIYATSQNKILSDSVTIDTNKDGDNRFGAHNDDDSPVRKAYEDPLMHNSIWKSSNYGETWSRVSMSDDTISSSTNKVVPADKSWNGVSVNADGSRVVAIRSDNESKTFDNDDTGYLGEIWTKYNPVNKININNNYKFVGSKPQILDWHQIGSDIDGEAAGNRSGYSVSLSDDGNTLAIGAIFNDGNGSNRGHVRVYEKDSATTSPIVVWTQIGGDIDGEADDDQSGYSVSLSGDSNTLAIGAPLNDGNGSNSGHVRVYERNPGNTTDEPIGWHKIGSDIDGEAASDQSGYSVSLSGDGNTLAIGAPLNGGTGSKRGHVRVYDRDDDNDTIAPFGWTQIDSDIDGEADDDESGYSVSLSGDGNTLAIGAIFNDGNGSNRGHVRVYKRSGDLWSKIGGDIDGEADNDKSGYSVSLSYDGNTLAVSAPNNNNNSGVDSGHVRVYERNPGNTDEPIGWTKIGSDIDGEAGDDYSGYSVSLSGDGNKLAVGAIGNNGTGSNSGHVRVYERSGNVWNQIGRDIDGEAAGNESGYSVSLSDDGNTLAIGAGYNNDNGQYSGHVRVYEYSYKDI